MRVIQFIGATLLGALVGGIVIMAIEGISSAIFPMPPGLDMKNPADMARFVSTLPLGAFLFVLAAWAAGSWSATYVARRIAPGRSLWPAVIACGLLLAGAVATMAMIPHPTWFWFAGIAACIAFSLWGTTAAAPSAYLIDAFRRVRAPLKQVFTAIASVESFSKAVPGITKIEVLTKQSYGVGTRFRETRLIHGKSATNELTVTEMVENERIRIEYDVCGAHWDTLFTVELIGQEVNLAMKTEARPRTLSARFLLPLMVGFVRQALEGDLDSIKKYCEQAGTR